jgi:hypothetical protein
MSQTYTCEICSRVFNRAFSLKRHKLVHFRRYRGFACGHQGCSRTFLRAQDRDRHLRQHDHPRAYSCGGKSASGLEWGCGKSFHRKTTMQRHWKSVQGGACLDQRDRLGGAVNASNERPGAAPSSRAGDENDSEPLVYSTMSSAVTVHDFANAHKQMILSLETASPKLKIRRLETDCGNSVSDFVDADFFLTPDSTARRLLLHGNTVTILSLVRTMRTLPSWVTSPVVSSFQGMPRRQRESFYTTMLLRELRASKTPEPHRAAQESTSHTEILTNLLQAIRTGNDDRVFDMIRQNASLDAIAANLRDAMGSKARGWNPPPSPYE